jgi:CheY-like chemotaxis protein
VSSTVLVKIVGFSAGERHAFDSLLRMSIQRSPSYALWTPKYNRPPTIAVVDGSCAEAVQCLMDDHRTQIRALWVGPNAPLLAWRSIARPIAWVQILKGMDDAFAASLLDAVDPELDFYIGAELQAAASQPPSSTLIGVSLPPPRRQLLVVDDDTTTRMYLRAKLSILPETEVDEAYDGTTALTMVRRKDYAGVLLDVSMPGEMDGYEICRAIKRMPVVPGAPPIKVFLITSRSGMMDRLRGTLCGADAYITKPPHPGRLAELVSTL